MSNEILLLSQQGLESPANRSPANADHFEAEDVLITATGADRVTFHQEDADPSLRIRRQIGNVVRSVRPGATLPVLRGSGPRLERDYRVAIAVVRTIWDVSLLETVRDLRSRADCVVLWVFELWPAEVRHELARAPFHLVDHVLIGTTKEAALALDSLIDPPVHFMPAGIDTELFVPLDPAAYRSIDLFNIGRRDEELHARFFERAKSNDLYYFFDTTTPGSLVDYHQHRWLLARHYQAAKLAMTSAAKFDQVALGERELRAIPNRLWEGLAGGAILVGAPSPSEENQLEHVGEVVVHELPADAATAADELVRLAGVDHGEERRHNIELARTKHDWSHRWGLLFDLVGQEVPSGVLERSSRLSKSC